MRAVIDGAPIGDDQPLKAPTVAQDILGQSFVFTAIATIKAIVCAHHCPRLCLPHGNFEGWQVDFVQGSRIDQRINNHALGFLIVHSEVFNAGARAGRLHAGDKGDGYSSGQIGVFAVIFEITAAKRASLDIYPGAQQDGNVFGLTFSTNCGADLGN